MQPFTHTNEESVSIDGNSQSLLDEGSKSSFVRVLDRNPLLLKGWIGSELSKTLQFEEIIEPIVVSELRSDESSKRRVALKKPAS